MSQMNGRMRPYLPELTIRDYNTYQWYLRGVRRQLYTTYGLFSCCCLRYNGVLFAILADSLAGRPATCKKMRVPGTLVWKEPAFGLGSSVFRPIDKTDNPILNCKTVRKAFPGCFAIKSCLG